MGARHELFHIKNVNKHKDVNEKSDYVSSYIHIKTEGFRISIRDNKLEVLCYTLSRNKNAGKLYSSQTKTFISYIYNLKTGEWFMKTNDFCQRKNHRGKGTWKKRIFRNPFFMEYENIVIHDQTLVPVYMTILPEDIKKIKHIIYHFLNVHNDDMDFKEIGKKWFVKYHGIETPDNFEYISSYYPGLPYLRKYKNWVESFLRSRKIYTKEINDIINMLLKNAKIAGFEMDVQSKIDSMITFLGYYGKDGFNEACKQMGQNNIFKLVRKRYKNRFEKRPVLDSDSAIKIIQLCGKEEFDSNMFHPTDIADHVENIKQLQRKTGIKYKIKKYEDVESFKTETRKIDSMIRAIDKKIYEYKFNKNMVKRIESLNINGWKPYILKSTVDCIEESIHQHNRITKYPRRCNNSFIISLRKENARVSLQYNYLGQLKNTIITSNKGIVQDDIDKINKVLSNMVEEKILRKPRVREIKSIVDKIVIDAVFNYQDEDDLLF